VLLTPFVEELLNRGIILRGLIKHGKVLAILLSSLIFGVFHAPQNILIASTVAIFLAIQYLNSGTLWAPIVSHASYNLLVMLDRNCLSGSRALADTSIGTAFVGSAAALLSVMTLGIAIAIVLSCKPVRSQGR
jgi:membrane protease YdiL (CAAX protease family)